MNSTGLKVSGGYIPDSEFLLIEEKVRRMPLFIRRKDYKMGEWQVEFLPFIDLLTGK